MWLSGKCQKKVFPTRFCNLFLNRYFWNSSSWKCGNLLGMFERFFDIPVFPLPVIFLHYLGFMLFKREWKPSKWTNTLATVIPFVPISFFPPLHKGLLRSLLFHYLPPRLARSHHSLISKRQYFLCFGTNPWAVTASTSPLLAAEEQKVRHWESQRHRSVLHPAPPRAQLAPPPPPHSARADRLRAVIRGLNI